LPPHALTADLYALHPTITQAVFEVFMLILVELEKEIEELRKKVEKLEKRDTQ
jgi:hypothetical protein